jgi:hypothetical protein
VRAALMVLGWLAVVGSIAISAMAGPHMSESELVHYSLYVVLVFGFGLGLALGALSKDRWYPFYGAFLFTCAAALARWWIIEHVMYPDQ